MIMFIFHEIFLLRLKMNLKIWQSFTFTIVFMKHCGKAIIADKRIFSLQRNLSGNTGKDYKVIFVGDASMSLYEIIRPGGSVEHFNAEAGIIWMRRILSYFDHTVWLNPVNEGMWSSIPSIGMVRQLLGGHMFPLTANGIMRAMKAAL